jgi:hypothetical protein
MGLTPQARKAPPATKRRQPIAAAHCQERSSPPAREKTGFQTAWRRGGYPRAAFPPSAAIAFAASASAANPNFSMTVAPGAEAPKPAMKTPARA